MVYWCTEKGRAGFCMPDKNKPGHGRARFDGWLW